MEIFSKIIEKHIDMKMNEHMESILSMFIVAYERMQHK